MFFVPTINHTPFPRFDQVEGLTNAGGKMPIRSPPVDFPSLTGDWRLLSHRSIPYASQVEARVALRCDHRGCIAFGKQLDAMRWRWNDTNVNQCYIKGAKTRPEAETWTSIKFELFSLCLLHDLSMWVKFLILFRCFAWIWTNCPWRCPFFEISPSAIFEASLSLALGITPSRCRTWRWLWDDFPDIMVRWAMVTLLAKTSEKNGEWLLMLGRTVLQSAKNSKESSWNMLEPPSKLTCFPLPFLEGRSLFHLFG